MRCVDFLQNVQFRETSELMEIIIADAQSPHIHIIGQINNLLDPVIASIEYLK